MATKGQLPTKLSGIGAPLLFLARNGRSSCLLTAVDTYFRCNTATVPHSLHAAPSPSPALGLCWPLQSASRLLLLMTPTLGTFQLQAASPQDAAWPSTPAGDPKSGFEALTSPRQRRRSVSEDIHKPPVDLEAGQKEQAAAAPQEKKSAPAAKIEFLNGLRGLAALLVVQQHGNYMGDINLGACAVDMFFVLSAFLLTMLFERKTRQMLKQRANVKQWGVMLLDYLSKRFFRVYPLFAAVAIALQILSASDRTRYFLVNDDYNLLEVLTFKFEARYHVFWTLPVEIGFYFMVPVFVVVIVTLGRRWWIVAIPLYVWVIRAGIHNFRTSHEPLSPHIPTFIAGSVAASVYAQIDTWIRKKDFKFSTRLIWALRTIEALVFGYLMSIMFQGLLFDWVYYVRTSPANGFPFVSVPITVITVIEMVLPSGLSRALEWNVLCYTGRISFSMYLLHSFIIYNPNVSSEKSRYNLFFAQVVLIYSLSTASYWLVEHPSQLAAQWISSKLTARSKELATDPNSPPSCFSRQWALLIARVGGDKNA